jgi:hypothetical protein
MIPYLLLSYGEQNVYLWQDDDGNTHEIVQGEGGEQGDSLMPAMFSVGLAGALREAQSRLGLGELVLAYLDDIYIVTRPERAPSLRPRNRDRPEQMRRRFQLGQNRVLEQSRA